jgi:hypothetical protein
MDNQQETKVTLLQVGSPETKRETYLYEDIVRPIMKIFG